MRDPQMKHVMAKFTPWLLLPEQKEHQVSVANDLIETATNEPYLAPLAFPKTKINFEREEILNLR